MLILALKISVAVMLFATGMGVTAKDVVWLWRRPILLGKSMLAMDVVAPAIAVLMAAGARGPNALPLVAGYLFASFAVSIPYVRWRRRVHARD